MTSENSTHRSQDSPWVLCESKSRPGQNYYFNLLSGDSKWDISEAEKANAKLHKTLPLAESEKCSEPKVLPNGYKKQINQFPNHLPGMYPAGNPGGSGFDPTKIWETHLTNVPVHNPALNVPVLPGQYILVPVPINQPNTNCAIPTNEYHSSHNTQRSHYNHQGYRGHNIRGTGQFERQNSKQFNKHKFNARVGASNAAPQEACDLRSKLQRRRKSQLYYSDNEGGDTYDNTYEDDNIGENHSNDYIQEKQSKYDLCKVKQLNSSWTKTSNWFVVVDIDILVHEFDFLNRFSDPEQNCYLLVPDHVMTELKLRAEGCDLNVKRICRFLTDQIRDEHAFKGDNKSDQGEDDHHKTFLTCVDYAQQDNVILLSNDTKYNKYRCKNVSIHVLTMGELKYTLNNGPLKQESPERPLPEENFTVKKPLTIKSPETSQRSTTLKSILAKEPSSNPTGIQITFTQPIQSAKTVENQTTTSKQIGKQHSTVEYQTTSTTSKQIEEQHSTVEYQTTSKQIVEQHSEQPAQIIELGQEKNTAHGTIETQEKKKIKLKRRWRRRPLEANTITSPVKNDTSEQNVQEATSLTEKLIITDGESDRTQSASNLSRASSLDQSASSQSKKPTVLVKNIDESSSSSTHSINKEKKLKKKTAVMYEVEGDVMEEVLRTRKDEWVTRFTQIMEEVLSQKLLGSDQMLQCKYGTYLHDAVKCVILKYTNDFNVVDAANNFKRQLIQITDERGNINIDPSDYMEMYSYGVYLVESLKDVCSNCEDLNAAHESLNKLLSDIKTASLDFTQDTFPEEDFQDADISGLVEQSAVEEEQPEMDTNNPIIFNDNYNRSQSSIESYGRSNRSKLPLSPKSPLSSLGNIAEQNINETTNNLANNNVINTSTVKIARNFVSIAKFEEKFKHMKEISREDNENTFGQKFNDICDNVEKNIETQQSKDNNFDMDEIKLRDSNFKKFIESFVGEIRGVIQKVTVLCYEILQEESTSSNAHNVDKAKRAGDHLLEMSCSLASIIECNNKGNLQILLKSANMEDHVPTEQLVSTYTDIISQCKLQTDNLRNITTLIVEKYQNKMDSG